VSVIIAVRNGERFLGQAIESVLAQTHERHEIVVVDGRSTDRSREIALSYPGVRCAVEDARGFAHAWNVGLDATRGELIAILDSDDRWHPRKLEAQIELMRQPGIDYAITRMRFFLEPGHPPPRGFRPETLEGDHVAHMPSSILVRRGTFDEIGRFRTDFNVANDIDWFARLKDSGMRVGIVPEVLVFKRVHNANLSLTAAGSFNRELLALLRESVARQRATS
jgi:glycosyltransferase involved in cell wall biosynthesis